MAKATFHFPRGFLWGTATASHQVEGFNTNNNWWAWEQQPGRILQGHKSGAACNWWGGKWREDFDRAYESHQNAHRFSIEWSRVQPLPDQWDNASLDRYREMARWLVDHNMTPFVTLHHFSDPIWLVEKGGWETDEIVGYFEKYVKKVVDALQEYVSLWVTINEPNVYALYGYLFGLFPPGKNDLRLALKVMENQVQAHAAAYYAIHEMQKTARVGAAINIRPMQPARPDSLADCMIARMISNQVNDFFPMAFSTGVMRFPFRRKSLPLAKNTQDFLGINFYTIEDVSFNLNKSRNQFHTRFYPPGVETSETGFLANRPEGMFNVIKWAKKFGVPIIIAENGIEDSKDTLRPRYLIEHLHQMWRAVNFNFPVKGYFHWTLVDNFEWERGWTQRFGLWELDVETQQRRKRPSADLYAEICQENGLSSEMTARFAPELLEKIFPD